MVLQASAQIQTRSAPEHRPQSHAMRVLLNLVIALLRCALAFFRRRDELSPSMLTSPLRASCPAVEMAGRRATCLISARLETWGLLSAYRPNTSEGLGGVYVVE
jgi:hypothetical protein